MLKIDKLKKQYKNFTLNCSMEVKEGMITGFVGPNGSGKSTTLKAVLGLIYIDGASCIIKMWMLKIENTSEYNKTTDWQVSKNLIIQRGIYNEV